MFVAATSRQLADIAYRLSASKRTRLAGMYTHLGISYAGSSPDEALQYMSTELEGLRDGALEFLKCAGAHVTASPNASRVALSLGATPTATSIQNLLAGSDSAAKYRTTIEQINERALPQ